MRAAHASGGECAEAVRPLIHWGARAGIHAAPDMETTSRMEPITDAFARHFAQQWIDAWNAHDLDRILSHYDDAFVMHSPMIARIAGEPSGCLHGKAAVRAYWAKALQLIPDLRFEFIAVLAGVDSVAIHYRGANGRGAVEVFRFGAGNRVNEAFAHYAA